VHHGSGRTQARVLFPEDIVLNPGDTSIAQLRFDHPIHTLAGERLVIRELSGEATLAGAIVLDSHPTRRQFRSVQRQSFLHARAEAPNNLQGLLLTHLERDHFVPTHVLNQSLPFSDAEVKAALKKLTKSNEIVARGEKHFAHASYWKELFKKASKAVQDYHLSHPDHVGMSTDLLKKNLGTATAVKGLFDALLIQLSEKNFKVADNIICHNSHSLELPPELEAPAAEILKILDESGLAPPLPAELQATPNHEAAYKFLARTRQIIPLDPKVTLGGGIFQATLKKVSDFIEKNGQATASELRQHLNTSRKVIMPLLERLDRDKVTRREGDFRTLI
jgi:selenocysteine-specific elongation factor